jgi:hypothetical protein
MEHLLCLFSVTNEIWNYILGRNRGKYKGTVHSKKKKVIRLITGVNKHEPCQQKFKKNRILMVASLYVLEVLCFIKKVSGELEAKFGES